MNAFTTVCLWILILLAPFPGLEALAGEDPPPAAGISKLTPALQRYVVRGWQIFDVKKQKPLFFKGMGYSPYLSHDPPP